MKSDDRYEYHFLEGRVVQRKIMRPVGKKRWRNELHCSTLITVIESSPRYFRARHGPAATSELIVDAVRFHQGLVADPNVPDLGPDVPVELAKDLSLHVEDALAEAISQYRSFAEEPDITGFLKGRIQKSGFRRGDWSASIKAWTYSRRPKERDLGVDIGIIIDILRGDSRVVKAMWFQAKKTDRLPQDILEIHDLAGQLEKMRKYTAESFALIYSAEGTYAYRSSEPKQELSVGSVIYDGVLCRRGDRRPLVIALTGDSKIVANLLITGPPDASLKLTDTALSRGPAT